MKKNELLFPHLTTAMTGPLHFLEKQILENQTVIENWFKSQWLKTPAPVYGSIDLRNAGFKLSPVDMNLFPAGFNNLNPAFLPFSIHASKAAIHQAVPDARRILIVPENHTRNIRYWENIHALSSILEQAGFTVRIGTLLPDFKEPSYITLNNNEKVLVETVSNVDGMLSLKEFTPDLILLNNDFSDGIPEVIQYCKQPILPPAELGWSRRLKSQHFQHYAAVCEEFSHLITIDPWLISPLFLQCEQIDFMQRDSLEDLVSRVELLFQSIQKKYQEYNITCKPYVVIKADAGTYGMAVMMIKSVDEVRSLNRKQRVSMSKSKGKQPVNRVILQEGVYTFETIGENQAVAEPVLYLWGESVVGGFYRVHKDRDIDENLNSPGMHFESLPFVTPCHEPCRSNHPDENQNRFYAYGVIARLSMLAAAREMEEHKGNL